jgi:catechol 2,3-dioxygenase-like lactoylglutathione lyase family enzyme
MARSRIRHLAIKSADPQRLSDFYQQAFGMDVLLSSDSGAVYLSDGYITLALLKCRPEDAPPGINHFGFSVEDAGVVGDTLQSMGLPEPTERPSNRPYAELRGMDPDGNLYDLSVHGYEKEEYLPEREAEKTKEEVG